MEFISKEKEKLLIQAGWIKEYSSLSERPASAYLPHAYIGMQSWAKYGDYATYELRIHYEEDGRHCCHLYLSGATSSIDFRIRSLKSMLMKFDLI